ncbi:D-alanine--D-alanine ligase [Nitrosophilus alvini]|uniref:D-alanine--D-alanine ligase n=1 Tax=Nitrosophilus alvini TaxID=2714855 RepID=UPI00190A36CD|nr:D-alanine--D-alanine ligase [Nitrosophilus alvini]
MKIAIVFGGQSFEHEISIVSAIALKDIIKENELQFIFLDAGREFYLIPESEMKSKLFSSKDYKKYPNLFLKNGGFYQKGLLKEKKVEADVVLNLVHGGDGEDGKLASLFEFFSIPYIGPRIEGSVISFNKLFTKMFAKEKGVKILPYQLISKNGERKIEFDLPVIIKPLRLGSSIGVSVVKDEKGLDFALDVAFEFDEEVLVEPFIEGVKEYNLAGCKGEDFLFSMVEEPQKAEFLDFEKKYLDFARTKQVLKADIAQSLEDELKKVFKKIYLPLFEGALIRCDFFVIDNEVYLNEINPIPGSMANYLFEDFENVILNLAQNLPKQKNIEVEYRYIHTIQKAKGK